MLNDTPDLDIDAPIEYVLTELGRQTLDDLLRQRVCINGVPIHRDCFVCGDPAPCGRYHETE